MLDQDPVPDAAVHLSRRVSLITLGPAAFQVRDMMTRTHQEQRKNQESKHAEDGSKAENR